MKQLTGILTVTIALALALVGCDGGLTSSDATNASEEGVETTHQAAPERPGRGTGVSGSSFTFEQPVFDIEAAPNGNILVAETVQGGFATGSTTIREIRTQGNRSGTGEIAEFTTPGEVTPIHGMAAIGQRNIVAARGGLDLAENAAVVRITPAGSRVVADIEAFEKENDPDKSAIEDWKDPKCAPASGPFTPGPQSNPYGLTPVSEDLFLVADAAGNTLLRVTDSGEVEFVALFTPPTEGADGKGGASATPGSWLEFPFDGGTPDDPSDDPSEGNCYVQPVPNSVAVGEDGYIYVGELTGVGALGVSRVWRIEPEATGAVCPSEDCKMVFNGFTSIINMAFGPDGYLYVVEYDEAGWLTVFGAGTPMGGTVNKCDVDEGTCEVATIGGEELSGLTFPTAITFDRSGNTWLLENNLAAPKVRRLE